jgi:hypothetical protein
LLRWLWAAAAAETGWFLISSMVFLDLIRDEFKPGYLTFIAVQCLPAGVV